MAERYYAQRYVGILALFFLVYLSTSQLIAWLHFPNEASAGGEKPGSFPVCGD